MVGSSCGNEEGRAFTRKLNKLVKNFDNVSLLSIEFHRRLYTYHGLQMNIKGKEAIAKGILAVLLAIVGKHNVNDPICLAWKDDLTKHSCFLHEEDTAQVRCEGENQGSNSENTKEETQLN